MAERLNDDLERALEAVRDALGTAHVVTSGPVLAWARVSTSVERGAPVAVVRPGSVADVRQCMRIFHERGVGVHPVSGGRNWGLGGAVPPREQRVVMDLRRMCRIVDLDEELGTLTVEPGVTYQQAYDHLRAAGSRYFISTTGSSPDASLVGNTVERGDGSGPGGEHFAHVAGLEVVLPTGALVRTGFARYGDTRLGRLHRFGVGPYVDGLFSQGRFGVVTRMTLHLDPLPRALSVVRLSISEPSGLGPLVAALGELRRDGTLRAAVGLWNDYRVVSARHQFPFDVADPKRALSRGELHDLAGGRVDAWHGVIPIYAASPAQARAAFADVEARLLELVDGMSWDHFEGEGRSGLEMGTPDDPATRFFQGVPHRESLRSAYFRKRFAVPSDPDLVRDRCGVIWACPTVPLTAEDVDRAVREADALVLDGGFEPLLAFIVGAGRTGSLIPMIAYDRDIPGEDARAMACHDAVLGRMVALGYLPHRLGNHSAGALPPVVDDTAALLASLVAALDPKDVLGPGRYV